MSQEMELSSIQFEDYATAKQEVLALMQSKSISHYFSQSSLH